MNTPTSPTPTDGTLESWIEAWRAHLRRGRTITAADAAELEDHLREQIDAFVEGGLTEDEAFLVAVKRVGAVDALTREFAAEHSERLWKQLVVAEPGAPEVTGWGGRGMWVALALAVAAGVAIKLPSLLFGLEFDGVGIFYPLNLAFFTLPFVAAWFAWERPVETGGRVAIAASFVLAAIVVNLLLFPSGSTDTRLGDPAALTTIHLPIVLWMVVGVAYVGGRWRGSERRMDFLRFTGEAFIYFVLIALGGGVLTASTFALFESIGMDAQPFVQGWLVPCGAAGATVVAAWLVETKKSVIENMAPVLARIFTPLFTAVLLAFVATMVATGRGIDVEREVLIAIDLLLVVVFGLLLYSISARDPMERPGPFDWIQFVLVGAALVVDLIALWAIGARITDFGFTPNRTAALGMNLVLLVNLAGSAVLYLRFLRGGSGLTRIWSWQTTYLYVIAGWAAVVAFGFPLVFG